MIRMLGSMFDEAAQSAVSQVHAQAAAQQAMNEQIEWLHRNTNDPVQGHSLQQLRDQTNVVEDLIYIRPKLFGTITEIEPDGLPDDGPFGPFLFIVAVLSIIGFFAWWVLHQAVSAFTTGSWF